jgi:hypothetical protein
MKRISGNDVFNSDCSRAEQGTNGLLERSEYAAGEFGNAHDKEIYGPRLIESWYDSPDFELALSERGTPREAFRTTPQEKFPCA